MRGIPWSRPQRWPSAIKVALIASLVCGGLAVRLVTADFDVDFGDIAQVVPATLTAVLVFLLGTAFVSAQIVVPVRSARATGVLEHELACQVAVGLVLLVMSIGVVMPTADPETCCVLPATFRSWGATWLVLFTGCYLISATVTAISVYRAATRPESYAKRLARAYGKVITLKPQRAGAQEPARDETPVDRVYDISRMYRGWIRTATQQGDSRELHVALTGLALFARRYCTAPGSETLRHSSQLPSAYLKRPGHLGSPVELNPLHTRVEPGKTTDRGLECYEDWSPKTLQQSETGVTAGDHSRESTWFANELGRALVRAIEFGAEPGRLLDRDLYRLLNTLENLACLFHRHGLFSSSGVLIRRLTEVGLGVRRCEAARADWFYGALVRLGAVHREIGKCEDDGHDPDHHRLLATGAGAGFLLVAEGIVHAAEGTASPPERATARADSLRTIRDLLEEYEIELAPADRGLMVRLAASGILEPREHIRSRRPTTDELSTVFEHLTSGGPAAATPSSPRPWGHRLGAAARGRRRAAVPEVTTSGSGCSSARAPR